MRPRYHDLAPGDFGPQLDPYDFVELKYDGLYAEGVFNADGWSIHGRNGALLRYGHEPCPDCYLRGEMIIDTEWAEAQESRLYGAFVAWDSIYAGAEPPVNTPVDFEHMRRQITEVCKLVTGLGVRMRISSYGAAVDVKSFWREHVLRQGYEGLIFRSADGQRYGRMKRVVTQDYVVTGVRRQGPRVTALYGGLWYKDTLDTVCTVPVKAPAEQARLASMQLVGCVFEAKGNAVLKSGALRHPRQAGEGGAVKWRSDKRAEECVL